MCDVMCTQPHSRTDTRNLPPTDVIQQANPSGISQALAVRPGHGTVAMKALEVLVNLYRLKVGLQQLYQYDVSFQRARSKRESSAPDQADPGVTASFQPIYQYY